MMLRSATTSHNLGNGWFGKEVFKTSREILKALGIQFQHKGERIMKKMLFVAVAIVLIAGVASAASVVGSKHDMRTHGITGLTTSQVCVFCHTPHMSTAAGQQAPLWNHSASVVSSYGVYTSSTLNVTPSDIGGQAVGSQSVSMLCMGCHDNTVGVNVVYKQPKDGSAGNATLISAIGTGSANLGTSLVDDHPVNFNYQDSITNGDTGLLSTPSASIVLFSGSVQCASCHNVHDPANTPFLRMDNTGSALCLGCHVK